MQAVPRKCTCLHTRRSASEIIYFGPNSGSTPIIIMNILQHKIEARTVCYKMSSEMTNHIFLFKPHRVIKANYSNVTFLRVSAEMLMLRQKLCSGSLQYLLYWRCSCNWHWNVQSYAIQRLFCIYFKLMGKKVSWIFKYLRLFWVLAGIWGPKNEVSGPEILRAIISLAWR